MGCISVTQIMDTDAIEARAFPDPAPRPFQVGDMCAGLLSLDHKGIANRSRQGGKDTPRFRRQRNAPGTGLAIGQLHSELGDVVPLQGLNLAQATAGQNE